MCKRLTTEEFIEKAKAVHGDKYEYDEVEYKNNHTKVRVTCPIHGIFMKRPMALFKGSGCGYCYGHGRTTADFVLESLDAHGELYDYTDTVWTGHDSLVQIGCPEHGVFSQYPGNHTKGHHCHMCNQAYDGATVVYLVSIESGGEYMLKVGITNQGVARRFRKDKHPDQHVTEIATLEFEDRQDAKTIEAYLHTKHRKHKFTPKVKFDGHTECFNIEALELIKQDFGV